MFFFVCLFTFYVTFCVLFLHFLAQNFQKFSLDRAKKSTFRMSANHCFILSGVKLEIIFFFYHYLGIKLRPSGSLSLSADELCAKARRAWFSISNIVDKDKWMPVPRAFRLSDSLVSSVALYRCEFWLPHILPKSASQLQPSYCQAGRI